jgi:haloacetate dehalogenase
MDIVPTYKLYTTTTKEFATRYWHWFFLIQNAPIPETLLHNNEEFILKENFGHLVPDLMPKEIFNEYLRQYKRAGTIHAMCEDYRAGATIDLEHDKKDLDVKIKCQMLVLWASKGAMEGLYDILETWRERAENVSGKSLPCGHWMPEELPNQVYEEIYNFLNA